MYYILTAIPLKQGLKLIVGITVTESHCYFNSNSIKTRIETHNKDDMERDTSHILTAIPLKQGLKLIISTLN